MPHSEPEGPLVKRQKLNVAAKASAAAKQGSRIFAPFRVRILHTSHEYTCAS